MSSAAFQGFKKEEVNIEIDQSGNITIKGRHDVGSNRFRHFSLTVKAPENTDMKGIVGNIEGGFYTVVFPKMDVPEAVQEGTEPGKKQLDADELDGKFDKGKEAALDTEASDSTEKAAAETSTEAAVEKTETTERDLETPTNTVKETILKKTYVLETEKVTKTQDEIATKEQEIATKTLETSADQEPQTISKIPEAAVKEPETVTNPTETAPYALESSATSSDNATTKMDTGPAEPETNTLTEMPKGDEPGAPDTAATNLKTDMVKYAIRNEEQEHEGVKKDGGLLENAIEMITEHKACIISVILAFSMGGLISRRISS